MFAKNTFLPIRESLCSRNAKNLRILYLVKVSAPKVWQAFQSTKQFLLLVN